MSTGGGLSRLIRGIPRTSSPVLKPGDRKNEISARNVRRLKKKEKAKCP